MLKIFGEMELAMRAIGRNERGLGCGIGVERLDSPGLADAFAGPSREDLRRGEDHPRRYPKGSCQLPQREGVDGFGIGDQHVRPKGVQLVDNRVKRFRGVQPQRGQDRRVYRRADEERFAPGLGGADEGQPLTIERADLSARPRRGARMGRDTP